MRLSSRSMHPKGLLLSVLLVLAIALGLGCDALSGGSKDKDETSADDDSSKKKKKKKKKKDKDEKDNDEDDKDDKATPSVPPPPPPPAPGGDVPPSCKEVIAGYECMKTKVPPQSQKSIDDSIQQFKTMFAQLGPAQSEATCAQMLTPLKDSLSKIGCSTTGPTPTPQPPGPVPPSPTPSPGVRSAVPTLEEWAQVTTEVIVHGSTKLNCETKMLREWVRVSCRGKNHTGGTPTSVTVVKGGNAGVDDFVLTGAGVTSLVIRWVEGVDVDASFSWTDRTHVLHVFWPRQSPEPPYKGKFDPLP